jgi:hypothetical protein
MSGVKTTDLECSKAFDRLRKCGSISSRKVISPESSIGKNGVPADQCLLFLMKKADASRGMPRCMEHAELSHTVPLTNEPIRNQTG